jgi:hypothetical protein
VKLLRASLLIAGVVLTLGPPLLFATFAILATRADPIDQAGWAALVAGSLILTMTAPQIGIMALLAYLFVRMMKER